MAKLHFQHHRSSVSNDPSEIILKCWPAVQETFFIISNIQNSCAALWNSNRNSIQPVTATGHDSFCWVTSTHSEPSINWLLDNRETESFTMAAFLLAMTPSCRHTCKCGVFLSGTGLYSCHQAYRGSWHSGSVKTPPWGSAWLSGPALALSGCAGETEFWGSRGGGFSLS